MKRLLLSLLFISSACINAVHTNEKIITNSGWHAVKLNQQISKMIKHDRADELSLWLSTAQKACKRKNKKIKQKKYGISKNSAAIMLNIAVAYNAHESIKILNKTQTDC